MDGFLQFTLFRVDKGDGSTEQVKDIRAAMARIASHLGIELSKAYEILDAQGQIETDFSVYIQRGE